MNRRSFLGITAAAPAIALTATSTLMLGQARDIEIAGSVEQELDYHPGKGKLFVFDGSGWGDLGQDRSD